MARLARCTRESNLTIRNLTLWDLPSGGGASWQGILALQLCWATARGHGCGFVALWAFGSWSERAGGGAFSLLILSVTNRGAELRGNGAPIQTHVFFATLGIALLCCSALLLRARTFRFCFCNFWNFMAEDFSELWVTALGLGPSPCWRCPVGVGGCALWALALPCGLLALHFVLWLRVTASNRIGLGPAPVFRFAGWSAAVT